MEVGHDTLRAWYINFSPCIAEERCHRDEVCTTLGALPIIALFYGFQRYFVGGTVAGGVKE